MLITIAGPLAPYRAGVIGFVAKLRKNGISGVKARPMMKCHRTVLVMSSCIRNWGLVGTPVPEENYERGQKLGSCAYPD